MGKKSKWYHAEVKVEDISFQPLQGHDLKLYRPIIKKFNDAKTTEEKQAIARELPRELFSYCRYCGKPIVTSISCVECHSDGTFNLRKPTVQYRIIDGKKYEVSCCEECLLDHFRDSPPKRPKYYYMKGNKYGAYSFGYSEDEYRKLTSMTVGVTVKSMTRKWGKEEGMRRWKAYCDKHSYIVSRQAYLDKYGEQGEKKYYEDRAMTLRLCIKRHGKEKGEAVWKSYCDKQSYSCSKEYYIEKWGEDEGMARWRRNREIFLKAGSTNANRASQISQELFDSLYKELLYKEIVSDKAEIYYEKLNSEYEIKYEDTMYFIDFYDKKRNIVIEFNGDYWHANPSIYESGQVITIDGKQIAVDDVWKENEKRNSRIKEVLGNPTFIIVWENDYRRDKEGTVSRLLTYFNQ